MSSVEDIYNELRKVYDPEIPVNIVDLGLIYDVKLEGGVCKIQMTLTSQACPEARTIPELMRRRVDELEGVASTEIDIVWEPVWSVHKITPEGREILGIDPPPEEATPEAIPEAPTEEPAAAVKPKQPWDMI